MHASIPVQPRVSSAAFLSLGFRPVYIAGAAWALISVASWSFMQHLLRGPLGGVWWHAHEM
ncbi:MAG: NnrS family protein, partial [Advenella sp.]